MRWVFREKRMVFSDRVGNHLSSHVDSGDRLYFYVTGKCWSAPVGLGGPQPRSGLVVGDAVVLTEIRRLQNRVEISSKSFSYGCGIRFERLTPLGSGLALPDVADNLDLLTGRRNYGQVLQRTPVRLSPHDAEVIDQRLDSLAMPFEDGAQRYLSEK